jgi:hypothetical protein
MRNQSPDQDYSPLSTKTNKKLGESGPEEFSKAILEIK